MLRTNSASSGGHSEVHTEIRVPRRVVMTRMVWFVFGVIEVLIGVRFGLMLLDASTKAGFVRAIYGVSGVFMAPFVAIFRVQRVSGATFEWSALVAIAMYALVAWGIVALIRASNPVEHSETVERAVKDDAVGTS
jgi:hypothetical protein